MIVGFIGTGTMGSMLIESFIASKGLAPGDIIVSNRTFIKAEALANRYPGMRAEPSNARTAKESDIVFLCVKPHEFKKVVDEIKPVICSDKIVVSITSPVLVAHLESELNCKIAKIIPSITNQVRSGASLCIYGQSMQEEDKLRIEELLGHISEPMRIDEAYTRIVSDLSSCGPAFMSFLLGQFIQAAIDETGIDPENARKVASEMLLGTGLLLTKGGLSPEEVQQRVAVPGGITAKALNMLRRELNGVFNHLIHTTHSKYNDDLSKVTISFYGEEVNGQ